MAKVTVVVQTVLVVSVLMILTGCATSADPAAKPSWANVASPVVESTDPVLTENGEVNPGTYWAEVARVWNVRYSFPYNKSLFQGRMRQMGNGNYER